MCHEINPFTAVSWAITADVHDISFVCNVFPFLILSPALSLGPYAMVHIGPAT